jgi:MFS superfamily sulfate permease-like transporter
VTVFELEGALFFGSVSRLTAACETLDRACRCLVRDLSRASTIDESRAMVLQQMSAQWRQRGALLLLAGVVPENRDGQRLRDFGFFRNPAGDGSHPDWCLDTDRATEAAKRLLLAAAGMAEPREGVPLVQATLIQGLDAAQ